MHRAISAFKMAGGQLIIKYLVGLSTRCIFFLFPGRCPYNRGGTYNRNFTVSALVKARVHLKPVFPPLNLVYCEYLVRVSSNPENLRSFHKAMFSCVL